MKSVTTFALAIGLILIALTTLVLGEEHYIYRNAAGQLVISNQPPTAGSHVLKSLELPEPENANVKRSQEGDNTRPSGEVSNPEKSGKLF